MFLLFAICEARAAPACEQTSGQTWETFEDYHPVTRKSSLLLEGALRTDCGLNGLNPYYQRAQAGFAFQVLRHLQIRPYYSFVAKQAGANRTHSIELEIIANNLTLRRWRMEEENRIEEEFRPSGDTTAYTNKFQFGRNLRAGKMRMEPYAEGYAKYDLRYRGFQYTRLYAGVRKTLTQKLFMELFFVRQFGSHLSPGSSNAIGLTLRASF